MKRLLLDYMKSLRHQEDEPEPEPDLEIKITELGYPVLPNVIMEKDLSKLECEKVLRIYLSQHYCECISLSGQPILT